MDSRERIKTILDFGVPDRIGIIDAPWPETVTRWHQEGLPSHLSVHEYFDFDVDYCLFLDTSFMLPEKVLEENEKFIVFSDRHGTVKKCWRNNTGVPLFLDYAVKDMRTWLGHKPRLKTGLDRISIRRWGDYALPVEKAFMEKPPSFEETIEKYQETRRRGKFIFLCTLGPFETARACFPCEDLFAGLLQSPQLFSDMFHAITELIMESFLMLENTGVAVDGVFLGDDIACKNGMLFSPCIYRQLLLPCYTRLCSFFKSRNLPVCFHTDGNLKEALPLLAASGIAAIQPLEARAGNDVRELKKTYNGKLVFVGNIDAVTLGGSKAEIEREIKSKILVAKENGGYIYHSDHSVPPSVSFENYQYAVELVRKTGSY